MDIIKYPFKIYWFCIKSGKATTTVKFELDLKAGTTCFETAFNLDEKGKTVSTACVYVHYEDGVDTKSLENYIASVPDQLLKEGYKQKVIPYD